jgi:hypothetical protein
MAASDRCKSRHAVAPALSSDLLRADVVRESTKVPAVAAEQDAE